ncbi:hypothetical protein [Xenorhabdus griffiniae]|uniref:Bc2l-C N-terminal domain-containing protein n=1 Tax=Xenorhabdus griffiniae TaxID=351672 RepID=A0ABY9XMZ2_9GAMM|nr:hypothetical protein [Xenorhabdus griffiniae]MBD1228970.1 hypothetical protein [Xenorhabdus griffiniae]MBE8588650.1 hypothetical protein [Xenorhabdus griffiniae]WMV74327.1 hypothetical protein QL128_10205 [Xenorhabdus griffiniae]WNH04007.1 hypothetical protein QL112_010210 [Xenorhabdus griffiniae]
MAIVFASINPHNNPIQTSSTNYVDIPGLEIDVSRYSNSPGLTALITLNIPTPYASGNNFPGGNFIITTGQGEQLAFGGFTYSNKNPESYGRMPFTLVASCSLASNISIIKAQWSNIRGSTVHIDSYASISAIIQCSLG